MFLMFQDYYYGSLSFDDIKYRTNYIKVEVTFIRNYAYSFLFSDCVLTIKILYNFIVCWVNVEKVK